MPDADQSGLDMRSGRPRSARRTVERTPNRSVSRRYWVNRRDGGPGRGARGTQGRAAEDAYPDVDGYPDRAFLDAGAYAVDPGYRGYAGGPPRPGDVPAGAPRTRPERSAPPRQGFPPRPPRGGQREQTIYARPWVRPEDAPQGSGRPRPRPGGARLRQPGGNRPRPMPDSPFNPSEQPIPAADRPMPPRGPRPRPQSEDPYGPVPGGGPTADGRGGSAAGRRAGHLLRIRSGGPATAPRI